MNCIEERFAQLKRDGKKGFIVLHRRGRPESRCHARTGFGVRTKPVWIFLRKANCSNLARLPTVATRRLIKLYFLKDLAAARDYIGVRKQII
jgi:hypothetical protein